MFNKKVDEILENIEAKKTNVYYDRGALYMLGNNLMLISCINTLICNIYDIESILVNVTELLNEIKDNK